ncbi:hypothetical protein LR48_Vigan08g047000 [Vigna angularis]|uniref:Uncharacterized protein n=1 Tax=Phaseolus angularis TaxID=3914 RepID=A0A0L9V3M3_PHAAN|nr:hypothetical protein LR48_Vigan08g047000 [Vigna angularis]
MWHRRRSWRRGGWCSEEECWDQPGRRRRERSAGRRSGAAEGSVVRTLSPTKTAEGGGAECGDVFADPGGGGGVGGTDCEELVVGDADGDVDVSHLTPSRPDKPLTTLSSHVAFFFLIKHACSLSPSPMQKEKLQPPLNGKLPLSGTQKPTLALLRGEKAAEGRKPTHALTAERKILDAQATSLPF